MAKRFLIEGIKIHDISAEGRGIGRHEERVVFVVGAVPGDVVDVMIHKKKKNYLEGNTVKLVSPSPDRIDPKCVHFGTCGGCKWQNLAYSSQLKFKQKFVVDAFQRIAKIDLEVQSIIPSPDEFYYRNKLEFAFSNKKWLTDLKEKPDEWDQSQNALGFHLPGRFDKILDISECHLQPSLSNAIRLAIKEFAQTKQYSFYDVYAREGWLRNLMIRNTLDGHWMVMLSVKTDDQKKIRELFSYLKDKFQEVSTWSYAVNNKVNDSWADLEIKIFSGDGFLEEHLGDLSFRISPKSFFQTNTRQTKVLYDLVKEYTGLTGSEMVYDLYCGTGTITNYLAGQAAHVIGLEYVDAAVEDAKSNSKQNHISNVEFFSGDMKDLLTPDFFDKHGAPQVIVTDPPRTGMHTSVIQGILSSGAHKVVYVSCNPATQARDVSLLLEKYKVDRIQPVDMFPHTSHVESVVMMTRK